MARPHRTPRRPPGQAGLARPARKRWTPARRTATTRRQRSRRRCAQLDRLATSRIASGRRRSSPSSSSSRGSTPPARTGRSTRSWRRSTRRAARSRRSRSRRPRSSATTSCGGSTSERRARARSASSTARTTRTCWSSASTTSSRGRSGRRATTRSTPSSRCWPRNGTTIVKFFLSIDRDEQRERFQARYDDPTKRWKFSLGDLEERKLLGRLPGRVRRGAVEDVDGGGAVVRHPGQPQVVPEPGGRDDPGRHDRRPQAGLPAGAGPPATWSSSRPPATISGPCRPRTGSRRRRARCPGRARDVTTLPPVRMALSIVFCWALASSRWAFSCALRSRSAARSGGRHLLRLAVDLALLLGRRHRVHPGRGRRRHAGPHRGLG